MRKLKEFVLWIIDPNRHGLQQEEIGWTLSVYHESIRGMDRGEESIIIGMDGRKRKIDIGNHATSRPTKTTIQVGDDAASRHTRRRIKSWQ
jgi:hypothetical protein